MTLASTHTESNRKVDPEETAQMITRSEIALVPSIQLFGVTRVRGIQPRIGQLPRRILALLALNAGSPVSNAQIMFALWGERLPKSSVTTTQTYILKVRRGAQLEEHLLLHDGGYTLDIRPEDVDVLCVTKDIKAAEALVLRDDLQEALRVIRQVLLASEKPFLADIDSDVFEAQAADLAQRLRKAKLMYFEVMLKLGRWREVLEDILQVWWSSPHEQDLAIWAMKALYGAARAVEATQVYARTRRVLAQEYALSPCPQLEALHRSILNSERVS